MPKPIITVEPLSATEALVSGSEALLDWRQRNTHQTPGFQFTPQFREWRKSGGKRGWDGTWAPGKYCHLETDGKYHMRCTMGVARLLAQEFDARLRNGAEHRQWRQAANNWLEVNKKRLEPLSTAERDYQIAALIDALNMQWCRIALATNAGKGALIALLAEFGVAHGLNVLILCDELAVYDALEGEVAEWSDVELTRVGQGVKQPPEGAAVLAMVPTLYKRVKVPKKGAKVDKKTLYAWRNWLEDKTMVLLDEADKATATSWRYIMLNARNSLWRVGFSGTFPDPEDDPFSDLKLSELMGPVAARTKNLELIQRKISAAPQVELHGFDVTEAAKDRPREWWSTEKRAGSSNRRHVFDNCMTNNWARHEYIRSLIRPNTPTAIIVNRVEHGKLLQQAIPGSVFLDGSRSAERRRYELERFQAGETQIIIVTKILDRGTNRLGHTADLIFVSGEGSTRQTLQRIGRGLRRTGGKEFLRLVDVIDRVELDPEHKDKWLSMAARYVHSAGRKRIQLYKDEGFEVEIIA